VKTQENQKDRDLQKEGKDFGQIAILMQKQEKRLHLQVRICFYIEY